MSSNSNDLSDLSIVELKNRRDNLDDDLGVGPEHIDEELSKREQERARLKELLDMKLSLATAEQAGLQDDRTVQELQEHVAELEDDLHPDPRSDLAEEAGVAEARLADLSESEVEEARTHVEAIRQADGASGPWAETATSEHRENLEALLSGHDVEVAELAAVPDDSSKDSVTAEEILDAR